MSGRKMVYPYTLTGKLAAFPYKFYYNNSPYFKYTVWSLFLVAPFFYKMTKIACSEANYVKLAEFRRKEALEFERHKEHLL